MIHVRPQRKERRWQRVTWSGVVLMLGCASFAMAYQQTVQPPWYQRIVFAASIDVLGAAQQARYWVAAWWPHRLRAGPPHVEHGQVVQQITLQVMEELRHERDRLQAILDMPAIHSTTVLGARVVLHNLRAPFKTIIIGRGVQEGVTAGMIAIAQGALVGRVERVTSHHAAVLLLTDPNHAVDVVTQRARVRGILIGRGGNTELRQDGGVTRMEFVLGRLDIEPGDVVVTSGLDGRYPGGLPVGTVQRVERSDDGIVREVAVVPAVDWTAIESVGLLPTPAPVPVAVNPESTS